MKRLLFAALVLCLAACSKIEITDNPYGAETYGVKGISGNQGSSGSAEPYSGPTILGKKIENIYSIKNLITARGNLGPGVTNNLQISSIKGTHIYIRFLPADEAEYCHLLDKGYILFDEPLDYEVEKSGWYYHDPSIADTLYTWQYTTLPINTVLPAVKYEILDTMCIMDTPSGPSGPRPPGTLTYEIWEKLVFKSGELLGLDPADHGHTGTPNYTSGPPGPPGAPGTRWTPSGKVTVYDNLLQKYIPVEGLKISITNGAKHAKGITDANGRFVADKSFTTPVWYAVKWENNDWSLKYNKLREQGSRKSNSKMRSSWYINFKDDSGAIFCHIHRAMMRAFYKEYLGMERPAGKWRMFRVVMKDSYDAENAGFFNRCRVMGLWPDITIYAKNSFGNYNPAEDIINTTSHELGHATHFKISNLYKKTDKTIKESWATAVGMYVTEEEYFRLSPDDYLEKLYDYTSYPQPNPHTGPSTRTVGVVPFMDPTWDNKQAWPYSNSSNTSLDKNIAYTPLFIDLVDSSNQQLYFNFIKLGKVNGTPGYWKDVPYDNIQGISMDRIQWAVAKSCDFESLSRSLKIIATEVGYSAEEIDWYLEYYKKYWVKK